MTVNDEMFDLYRLVSVSADVRVIRRAGLVGITAYPPDGRLQKDYAGSTLGEAVLAALRDMGDPQVPHGPDMPGPDGGAA